MMCDANHRFYKKQRGKKEKKDGREKKGTSVSFSFRLLLLFLLVLCSTSLSLGDISLSKTH